MFAQKWSTQLHLIRQLSIACLGRKTKQRKKSPVWEGVCVPKTNHANKGQRGKVCSWGKILERRHFPFFISIHNFPQMCADWQRRLRRQRSTCSSFRKGPATSRKLVCEKISCVFTAECAKLKLALSKQRESTSEIIRYRVNHEKVPWSTWSCGIWPVALCLEVSLACHLSPRTAGVKGTCFMIISIAVHMRMG